LIEGKIKVAHISTPFTWRGGEQQIAYLYKGIEELNALGAFGKTEQWIICPIGSAMEKYCKDRGWNHKTFIKRSGTDPFSAAELKKICNDLEIDLLHAHDSHAHTMAVLSGSLFRNRTPFVLSRRVDFPLKHKPKTRFKYNHKNLRAIICVSHFIEQLLVPHISNKEIKLVTIHSGVELDREEHKKGELRKRLGIANDRIIVANTSALADHKDYPTFIQVAKKLIDKSPGKFTFVILGAGPRMSQMKELASAFGIDSEDLVFGGFHNDLNRLWPDIDIFFFPSKTEGLGTSLLDAFANNVPAVASNTGGIPEIVIHQKTGLLNEVGDVDGFASSIETLSEDQQLKSKLVEGASEHLTSFDRKITAQQTLLHYRDALK
jgi:glycosyltransferase involved in cell wall biosynthesis